MRDEIPVYRLNDQQFADWKAGRPVRGPVATGGSGCLVSLAMLPLTVVLAALGIRRPSHRGQRGRGLCSLCGGAGEVVAGRDCPRCGGTGNGPGR